MPLQSCSLIFTRQIAWPDADQMVVGLRPEASAGPGFSGPSVTQRRPASLAVIGVDAPGGPRWPGRRLTA